MTGKPDHDAKAGVRDGDTHCRGGIRPFISDQLARPPVSAAVSVYDEDTVMGLYEQTVPAVAEISVTQSSRIFGRPGTGTGFLVDSTIAFGQ